MNKYTTEEKNKQNAFIKEHYGSMTTKQIAHTLKIPHGTVITRAHSMGIGESKPRKNRHVAPSLKPKSERGKPPTMIGGSTYDNEEDEDEILREIDQSITLPKIKMDY